MSHGHTYRVILSLLFVAFTTYVLASPSGSGSVALGLLGIVIADGLLNSISAVCVASAKKSGDPRRLLMPAAWGAVALVGIVFLLACLRPVGREILGMSLAMSVGGQFLLAFIRRLTAKQGHEEGAVAGSAEGAGDLCGDAATALTSLLRASWSSLKEPKTRFATVLGLSLSIALPLAVPLFWPPDLTPSPRTLAFDARHNDRDVILTAARPGRVSWTLEIAPEEAKK